MMVKMKILRRVDGAEFPYSEALAARNDMRTIEVKFENGKRVGKEVDLSRLEDKHTEQALRQAIARKWPHLMDFVDHPELLPGYETSASIADLAGVVPATTEDGAGQETLDDPAQKPQDDLPGAPAQDEEPVEAPDPVAEQVKAFADRLMALTRDKVAEAAEAEGISVALGNKGRMVADAAKAYEDRLRAEAGKE